MIGQGHQCAMPTPPWPWNNLKVLKSDLFILQLNGGRHCVKKNWHILLNSAHSLGITSSLCSRNTHNYDCNVCTLKTGFVKYAITCHTKNVMNMHAWPRVSEILPASLSTGKSLGLLHWGALAALFICPVLSDPDCFLFRNRPWDWWTDTNYVVSKYTWSIDFCGQFGANN